ncbi:MAG TPA: signal peptidase II [Candidatus Sellimonas avistercoris]|nr:signal peptidase II [Candidatus Sellimonas avistercoris]
MNKKNGLKNYVMAVILVIVAVLIDQYTKYLAVTHLKDGPAFVLIDNVFELNYLENRGAAFGLLQNRQIFFVCVAILIFAFILYCYVRIPKTGRYLPLRLCGIFIVAGAAGNLIDRIRLGYVVDFFYFRLIDFPVFNVADIYVTASFAVLLILIFFRYKEEELEFLGRKKGTGTDGK